MICATCDEATLTTPCACGADPLLDARFELTTCLRTDRRGAVYAGRDAGRPVRIRICAGPTNDDHTPIWRHTATQWITAPQPCMAAPVAHGELGDGRWYRVERAMQGHPPRSGGTPASIAALLDQLLSALVDLHAHAISHGGLSADAILRRPDGTITLVDFSPDARTPADDVRDAARLATALCRDPFDASIRDVLRRMQVLDPAERPSAAAALDALSSARRWRQAPQSMPVEPAQSRVVPLFLLFLVTVGAYFWLQRQQDAEFWQGELAGEVIRASGDAPIQNGRPCRILVTSGTHGRNNCQVRVTCDDRVIYGGESLGFARCDGSPVHANDAQPSISDSDPQLNLIAARGRAVVSDRVQSEWRVEIGLHFDEE